jgi:hypothetical protein
VVQQLIGQHTSPEHATVKAERFLREAAFIVFSHKVVAHDCLDWEFRRTGGGRGRGRHVQAQTRERSRRRGAVT